MSSGNISGVGKLDDTSASYNMMTIHSSIYGWAGEWSVFTQATTVQELYEELANSVNQDKWIISHGTFTANLSGGDHPTYLIFPRRISASTYNNTRTIKIESQQVNTDWTNGYYTITSAPDYYIFPYGGAHQGDPFVSASITRLQQFI